MEWKDLSLPTKSILELVDINGEDLKLEIGNIVFIEDNSKYSITEEVLNELREFKCGAYKLNESTGYFTIEFIKKQLPYLNYKPLNYSII